MKKRAFTLISMAFFCCQLTVMAASPITDGLIFHLEADAITGIADGNPIAGWPATVGNDAALGGSAVPNYVADSGGGTPAVDFFDDGYIAFDRMTNIRTVYWVLKEDTNANKEGFLLGDESVYHFHRNTDNGYLWTSDNTSANILNGITHINGSQVDGTATRPPTSLGIVSVVTTGDVTASSFSQDRTETGRNWDGLLAELLIYDRPLSAAEENEVGYYLETKYNLNTSYLSPVAYIYNPSPADGATRIAQDVQLNWNVRAETGTPSFDVYFSANPDDVDPNTTPAPVTTTSDLFYTPDGPLDPATLYYWRIDVTDDVNTVPLLGDVYTFTTGGDVVDVYPTDGATGVETIPTVTWTGDAEGSSYIDEYDIYFGETLPATPTATVTEPQWQTPELADGTTYQCKIVSLHLGVLVDEATVSFTTGELIGYWPFDDSLADTIGTNDGTRGNPHFAEGVINNTSAADFYGDEPIAIPIPDISTGGNWAISFWEFSDPETALGSWETILGNGAGPDGWEVFEFGRYNFNRYILGFYDGDYQATANDSSYLRGGWQCHVMSYNSQAKLVSWYINGEKVIDYTDKTFTLHNALSVGNVSGGSQPFTGRVDDLKVYSRPLTDTQILQNFIDDLAGKPYNPNPASGITDIPWDATLEWAFAETPDSAVIEVGTQSDLSDAVPVALTGDMSSFDTYAGLGVHLTPSTGYYWRVTPTYGATTVVGPTWYFVVRDLNGDLSGDLTVDKSDLIQIVDKWLDDTSDYLTGPWVYLDQDIWSVTGDPNVFNYVAPWAGDGTIWAEGTITLQAATPNNDAEIPYDPNDQTLLWSYDTSHGGNEHGITIQLPETVDFSKFDKFGYWVYQTNCASTADIRIDDENGNNIYRDWYDMGSYNDQWHKYEWDIPEGVATQVYQIRFYRGSITTSSEEFGDFFLVKDDLTVKICLPENLTNIEDLNLDCKINLIDLSLLAQDWLLDASN